MQIVLDASVALVWCFADEASTLATRVLEALTENDYLVPAIWPLEIANSVLIGERRGRLSHAQGAAFLAQLYDLPVRIEAPPSTRDLDALLSFARRHELAVCDASYLELAARAGACLATLDARLAAAATRAGVPLFA
jgi:predicted nucleic acid-binding protein